VFVVAEGEAAAVEAFLAALREGPPGASVSSVEVSERMATGTSGGFGIRSGSHRGD
jgi:acylphosphatase